VSSVTKVVRVGTTNIGSIVTIDGGRTFTAFRHGGEKPVCVGEAKTETQAANLIAMSFLHRAMDDRIPPDKRARLTEALNQLEGLGLGDIASFIQSALR
jgi:hypothetical protein